MNPQPSKRRKVFRPPARPVAAASAVSQPAGQQPPEPMQPTRIVVDSTPTEPLVTVNGTPVDRKRNIDDLRHCLNEMLRYGRPITRNVEQIEPLMRKRHPSELQSLAETLLRLLAICDPHRLVELAELLAQLLEPHD
ncbi:MAG TPA: hypothetical protein VMP01_06860 [Pirellulaceae bacterium]|nr:hypothetical protein [Pirellulaceae bacterium]